MPRDYVSLGECRWPMVRLYCPACRRFAQFKRATLLKRFGPAQSMPEMLSKLNLRARDIPDPPGAMPVAILGRDDTGAPPGSHCQGWSA